MNKLLFVLFVGTDVKQRWVSLRDQYRKYIKRTGNKSGQGASKPQKWKFSDEMFFIHKFLRERETITNTDELGCDSENVNNQSQVEYSTEDITDNEDREVTNRAYRNTGTNDGDAREEEKRNCLQENRP
jgi:hypothetical protein